MNIFVSESPYTKICTTVARPGISVTSTIDTIILVLMTLRLEKIVMSWIIYVTVGIA